MKATLDKQIDIRGLQLIGRVRTDPRIEERRTYTNHQNSRIIHSNEEHNQNKEQAEKTRE